MKRRTVAFAPEARDDLSRIYDWIAQSSSSHVALSFVERIEVASHSIWLQNAARPGTT